MYRGQEIAQLEAALHAEVSRELSRTAEDEPADEDEAGGTDGDVEEEPAPSVHMMRGCMCTKRKRAGMCVRVHTASAGATCEARHALRPVLQARGFSGSDDGGRS